MTYLKTCIHALMETNARSQPHVVLGGTLLGHLHSAPTQSKAAEYYIH
jgi:hypothetical protein